MLKSIWLQFWASQPPSKSKSRTSIHIWTVLCLLHSFKGRSASTIPLWHWFPLEWINIARLDSTVVFNALTDLNCKQNERGCFPFCVSLNLIGTAHVQVPGCCSLQGGAEPKTTLCVWRKKPSGSSAEDDKLSTQWDARHMKELFLEALAWSRGRWATASLLSNGCCHLCGPNELESQTASRPAFNLRWADTLTRSGQRQQTLTPAESQSQFGIFTL